MGPSLENRRLNRHNPVGHPLEAKHNIELGKEQRLELTKSFTDYISNIDNPHLKEIADNNDKLLALAQHYGFPTNLLDFTYNPYIAEYFACGLGSREEAPVGVIFAINLQEYETFVNPYKIYKDVSKDSVNLTKQKWRRDFPDHAYPDHKVIKMPSWEKRICRQHGLFIDGSNLNLVYDNIIDRFYFRLKGRAFGAPREFADDIDFDLLQAEEWLESVINDFITRHFGEQ